MAELPIAPIGRIIKNAGAQRITDDAIDVLRDYLEKEGERVAHESINMAKHAGRKSVKGDDIKLVIKNYGGGTVNIHGIQAGSNNSQNFEGDMYNFSQLYTITDKKPNSEEVKENIRLIEEELDKGDICLSKIKRPIELITRNAPWAIQSIANLTLAAVNLGLV